jgi:hypothetical protein
MRELPREGFASQAVRGWNVQVRAHDLLRAPDDLTRML